MALAVWIPDTNDTIETLQTNREESCMNTVMETLNQCNRSKHQRQLHSSTQNG